MRILTLKNFSVSVLLVIAISLSGWSILLSQSWHTVPAKANPTEADSFMQDVVATLFNKQGKPRLSLSTPKMMHYPAGDTTKITTPHVTLYRESPKPWFIDADFAQASDGIEQILFWDNVNIHHPADLENPTTTMLTDSLTMFPNEQLARTDQAVTFIQPETTIHAVGMLAHLDVGTIQLLSQAKGEYAPSSL